MTGNVQVNTQHEFFQQHAVDGILPDHLMGELLALPEGDTPFVLDTKASSATPGADEDGDDKTPKASEPAPATPATPEPTPAPTPAPVIVAKDGVHTIPYEKLEEARRGEQAAKEAERQAREAAERLAAENEALKKAQVAAPATPAATPAPATPASTSAAVDFGDYSDESMQKAMAQVATQAAAAAVERATAPLLAELEQLKGKLGESEKQAEVDATKAHFTAIYTAYPNIDSIMESAEFKAWRDAQPAFMRPAIDATLEQGTSAEVIELFDTYTGKAGKPTPPAGATQPAADAAALAAARVAAAKTAVPTSLSEIPAGTSTHHDEAAAMLEMNPNAVMAKFDGKTPEQIQALLNKVL